MAYEVVVMSQQYCEWQPGCWMETRIEVNGTAASVTTPGHLGIDYHREMVEQAINKLSQAEEK